MEQEEEPAPRISPPKRRRSYSSDSVSTISTRSPSPSRRGEPRGSRNDSPRALQGRRRSLDSGDGYSNRPSESPDRRYSDRASSGRRSPSPRRETSSRHGHRDPYSATDGKGQSRFEREYSRSRSRSLSRSRSPARSPVGQGARGRVPRNNHYRDRSDHGRRDDRNPPQRPPQRQPSPPRERSLSPFSKRLALTQAMNMSR